MHSAQHEAMYLEWRETAEAQQFSSELPPEEITRDALMAAEPIRIGECEGQPVLAYRILRYLGGLMWWEIVWRQDDIRLIRASNLWIHEGESLTQGLMAVPSLTDDSPLPEVYALAYGPDPDTGEPYMRYGALIWSSGRATVNWYDDLRKARYLHQTCLDEIRDARTRHQEWHEYQKVSQAWGEVYDQFAELRDSPVFKRFGQPVQSYLQRFEQVCQEDRSIRGLRLQTIKMRTLLTALRTGLETIEQERLALIRGQGLVAKLERMLKRCIPVCPICFGAYAKDDAWLERLLLEGQARLQCDCPADGWHDKDDKENIPPRARDIFVAVKEGATLPQIPLPPVAEYEFELADDGCEADQRHEYILRQLMAGERCVATFLGSLAFLKLKPEITVDMEALAASEDEKRTCLVDDWTSTMERLQDERLAKAEEEVLAGKAVKLGFRWDEGRKRWSTRAYDLQGHKTIWVVDEADTRGITENTVFYCRLVRTPPRVQTPTLSFHVVHPYLRATKRPNYGRNDAPC